MDNRQRSESKELRICLDRRNCEVVPSFGFQSFQGLLEGRKSFRRIYGGGFLDTFEKDI